MNFGKIRANLIKSMKILEVKSLIKLKIFCRQDCARNQPWKSGTIIKLLELRGCICFVDGFLIPTGVYQLGWHERLVNSSAPGKKNVYTSQLEVHDLSINSITQKLKVVLQIDSFLFKSKIH